MKIMYIGRFNPFFENSAGANRLRALIEGLSDLGVNICLKITNGYHSKTEAAKFGSEGKLGEISYFYHCKLIHDKLWQRRINKFLFLPIIYPLLLRIIKKDIEKEHNIIVWTECNHSFFKLVVKLKKCNPDIKSFLEVNEFFDVHRFKKGRLFHKWEGEKRANYFIRKGYYAYDGIALMTKTLMKQFMEFPQPGPMLLHLPMTVDFERFKGFRNTCIDFDKPYIAFIGVMDDQKEGINILIQAFAQVADEFPMCKLYLVGSWNYDTPAHLRLISELKLNDRVFWKGEYPRDDIPSILVNACLLVLPRPNSKQAQGGFPTKLGEYLATGNPVCATRVGEIPNYLVDGESVFFAEPDSVKSLASSIRRALSNPKTAIHVGLNGRKVAEKFFNKDKQALALNDFFKVMSDEKKMFKNPISIGTNH